MSFFKKVLTDVKDLEKEYLGPDFKYYKFIKNPDELGVSSDGSISALSKNIQGIVSYVEVLINGKSKANKLDRPLGGSFFLKTGGQCKDYKTNKVVTRSMYIDNVPTGRIPIVSGLTGFRTDEFRGLVPGVVDNIMDINPLKLFGAFMEGSEPLCAEVSLPVTDEKGRLKKGSGFVPISELKDLISNGKIENKNLVTSRMNQALEGKLENETTETFQNIMTGNYSLKSVKRHKKTDNFTNIYYLSIAVLFSYILIKLIMKK